jgi:predicted acyltransferase
MQRLILRFLYLPISTAQPIPISEWTKSFFFYSSGLSVLDLVDQHETIDIAFLTEEKVICSIYLFF